MVEGEYLEPEQAYIDRYDLATIKECIDWGNDLFAKFPEMRKGVEFKDLSDNELKSELLRLVKLVVYSIQVSKYEHKKDTIAEWRNEDKKKQDRYDKATPDEIYCPHCNVLMADIHKDLHDFFNEPLRVFFMYECPKCNFRKAMFDDSTEYKSKPQLCESCNHEIKVTIRHSKKKNTTTWTYKCTHCDYKNTNVDDHKKWQKEQKESEEKDKQLLQKYRTKFCLNEEKGNEAVFQAKQLHEMLERWKEDDKKKNDPVYIKARSLKNLRVAELNKLLKKELERKQYTDLIFEKPNMGRFVAVPFAVQDSKTDREEYDSRQELRRLIKKTLETTNWRLMSDGINYRVGYLSGRLRCYENENELTNKLKKEK